MAAPGSGLWRVGRVTDPLQPSHIDAEGAAKANVGNRYDTPAFGTLYFGSTQECCFGETLAKYRPSPSLATMVEEDWRSFMGPGQVAADWRERRSLVRVEVHPLELFLNVDALETREYLRTELALGLSSLGKPDLDVSLVRSGDRRVSRLIASWAFNQQDDDGTARYAGIRYTSRLHDDWVCWAAFDDVTLLSADVTSIELNNTAFETVCTQFNLHPH